MLVVEPDIEQRPAVGRPFKAAVVVDDQVIDNGAGFRLDDLDRVELRAFGVDGVGDELVVGAMRDIGDAEIGVVLGKQRCRRPEPARHRHSASRDRTVGADPR